MKFIIILYIIYIIINNLHNQTGVQFVQGVHNNKNNLTNTNESILYYSIEKLKKDELVQTVKELQSKVKEDKKLTFFDIIKLFYRKVYYNYSFIVKFLSKLTILSIIFKLISKIKLIRVIWVSFYSIISFIFGLAYSEVYGYSDLIEIIKNYWSQILTYIHDLKLYKLIIKVLSSTKEIEEISNNSSIKKEIEEISNNSKNVIGEDNEDFSSKNQKSETNQISNIKNDRWNNRNIEKNQIEEFNSIEENNKPFYLNWYFLISVSIISVSLIYYYWDNINELIEKIKNIKPGDNPPDRDNTPKARDIELNDLTEKIDINSMDLESINKFHDKISIETKEILAKIDNRIKFLEEHSNLKFSQEIKMNIDFKKLFDQLKSNQINHIEIFNKLSTLKLEDGTAVLNPDNRNNLIKNINVVNSTLIKYHDLIPNYNLHLDNLPDLNIELVRSTSPELTEASLQVENLNTSIEKSWGASSSKLSPQSDGSDDTIKASK